MGGRRAGTAERPPKARQSSSPPLWEWLVAGLGAALLVAALAVILVTAVRDDGAPPDVVVRVQRVVAGESSFLVEVEVDNRGGSTAADLEVSGELRDGARLLERSRVRLDFVPAGSRRQAGLFFRADPRRHRLVLRTGGFLEP